MLRSLVQNFSVSFHVPFFSISFSKQIPIPTRIWSQKSASTQPITNWKKCVLWALKCAFKPTNCQIQIFQNKLLTKLTNNNRFLICLYLIVVQMCVLCRSRREFSQECCKIWRRYSRERVPRKSKSGTRITRKVTRNTRYKIYACCALRCFPSSTSRARSGSSRGSKTATSWRWTSRPAPWPPARASATRCSP